MSLSTENKRILEEKRHREIIRSAKKLFYTNGFRATTMEAIAKDAGISKGLIYHYFKNKEDLLFSFRNDLTDYLRKLKEMEDPEEALIRFGSDFLVHNEAEYADAPPTQILLTTFGSREVDVMKYADLNPIRKDVGREYLGNLFRRGITQGIFRNGDAEEFGDIYWSFLLGKLLQVKRGNESENPEVYVREILNLFRSSDQNDRR